MTDIEKMELALRRALDHMLDQHYGHSVESAIQLIINELVKIAKDGTGNL